jgi:uncharacterized protein (TIGR04551 family)
VAALAVAVAGGPLTVVGGSAWAQFGPGPSSFPGGGGGLGGGAPGTAPMDTTKSEGPAEKAPTEATEPTAAQPLPPWPEQSRRALQFFELHGYVRTRSDYLRKLNLGQPTLTQIAPSAFELASCVNNAANCDQSAAASVNMRLRLEPTIHVSEDVRVHAQFDVYDNLLYGSTPDNFYLAKTPGPAYAHLPTLSQNAAPPEQGRNTTADAIGVKRVWGEVDTPVGTLRFGRMPWKWGMGLLRNDGGCWDCDYGDNVDRIELSSAYKNHVFGASFDWVSTGLTTATLLEGKNQYFGQPLDADNRDDVKQFTFWGGRIEDEQAFARRAASATVAINYGGMLSYRSQDQDLRTDQLDLPDVSLRQQFTFVRRGAYMFTPDAWVKARYKNLDLELEGAGLLGKIENVTDVPDQFAEQSAKILQLGWALRSQLHFLKETLETGLEIGFASGDQAKATDGSLNTRNALFQQGVGNSTMNAFRFNFDYHVDILLFRQIIGAVTNATYFKPWVSYDLFQRLTGKLALVYAFANNPDATPGASRSYGLELDADIGYRSPNEGFFAGFRYGAFFPMGALDRPEALFAGVGKDAETAQALQTRLIIRW